MRRPVIGVMGGHIATPEVEEQARLLGAAIAEAGWILLNGGRDEGVMRAAAQGCKEAGGFSVGIHPGRPTDGDVAPDLDLVIYSGIGFARNMSNILSSDVVVCLPGGPGTLSEAAYAATFERPLILFGFDDKGLLPSARRVQDLDACLQAIVEALA